jgi:iron(III) transport system substrate-binding protein
MQQIITEGASSPADLFVTVDAGNLWKAQKEGLFEHKITSSSKVR